MTTQEKIEEQNNILLLKENVLFLSIVIPVYNEEKRLNITFQEIKK